MKHSSAERNSADPGGNMTQSRLPRGIDVLLSLVLFVVGLPIMVLVSGFIYAVSGGQLLLRQERIGLDGKPFELLKFRTMAPEAERDHGPVIAALDDHRIIRGGRTIRALHIDELPQLLNVLRGDMSLVGPRPERPQFVEQLRRDLHGYERRHAVRPGITGRAQVIGGYYMDPADKLAYDLSYAENQTVWQYLAVLLMTPVAIFRDLRYTHMTEPMQQPSGDESHRPLPISTTPFEHERTA